MGGVSAGKGRVRERLEDATMDAESRGRAGCKGLTLQPWVAGLEDGEGEHGGF